MQWCVPLAVHIRSDEDGPQQSAEAWRGPESTEGSHQRRSKAIQVPGARSKRWQGGDLQYPAAYKPPLADLPNDLVMRSPPGNRGQNRGELQEQGLV